MKRFTIFLFSSLILSASSAFSCGIEGTAVNSDGSKINGSGRISTSWNSKKAFPSRGRYQLDLGSSACGNTVTVYLNGNQGQRVRIPSSGYAWVSFVGR